MVEGLEVVIRYRGTKYGQVAYPKSTSSEFAILKKDLAYLRVHSPSQKNVRRVHGSFVLHWPNATVNQKVDISRDSLYTRWIKLCSDDPEAFKLREVLSIESITMKQDGVFLYSSTPGAVAPPPKSRASTPGYGSPMESPPPPPPAPLAEASTMKHTPTSVHSAPRTPPWLAISHSIGEQPGTDRQQRPHLKRRKSTPDGPSNQTRQKLDVSEGRALDTQTQLQPTSPKTPQKPAPREHALPSSSSAEIESMEISPPRELGELTPRATPNCSPGSASASASASAGTRLLIPRSVSLRYTGSPSSSGSVSHHHHHRPSPLSLPLQDAPRRREQDANRLMRELWDTRRELAAIRAREQVILGDLGRLGVQVPAGVEFEVGVGAEGAGARGEGDQNGNTKRVSREDLQALEAELRDETARRVRAERALGDVERECRAPFVVPALFQAFMSISELSS